MGFKSAIRNPKFRNGGGAGNRTRIQKPTPKDSTCLAASLFALFWYARLWRADFLHAGSVRTDSRNFRSIPTK